MLSQSPTGGFQGQSLVVTDKSDSVVTKRSRSRRRKKTVWRKMKSTYGIGLLQLCAMYNPTNKRLNNSGR